MKNVILSADSELKVYLVPDFVAESLGSLCTEFSENWRVLQVRPRDGFDEADFIEYLNEKRCESEKCVFVESLGWDRNRKKWPERYRKCPSFGF